MATGGDRIVPTCRQRREIAHRTGPYDRRMADTATCDSCGRDEPPDGLDEVRRVYVTPERWDTEGKVEVVDEIERWCFACRTHYPHQPVDA